MPVTTKVFSEKSTSSISKPHSSPTRTPVSSSTRRIARSRLAVLDFPSVTMNNLDNSASVNTGTGESGILGCFIAVNGFFSIRSSESSHR